MSRLNWKLSLILGLLCVSSGLAAPWHLTHCSEESRALAAQSAARLRAARPHDDEYLPHPFPRTPTEIAGDFAHQYLAMHAKRSLDQIEQWERPLLSGLRERGITAFRVEAVEVANWREKRCLTVGFGAVDAYWLLRIFLPSTGGEIARASLHASGRLASYLVPDEVGIWSRPEHMRLATAGEAQAMLAAFGRSDIRVRDVQYVALYGAQISCGPESPCLTFRDRGRVFLLAHGVLYELDNAGERFRSRDVVLPGPKRDLIESKLRPDQSLVGIGADEVVVATRLN